VASVLVPLLFRIGLSLTVATKRTDEATATVAEILDSIEALDQAIRRLRRAALRDLSRRAAIPTLDEARNELRADL
jgi:hypothetical protein